MARSSLPIAGQPALPTVDALNALWSEVSSRPLWASPNFFRYLKLRWRMRLAPVRAERLKILAPRGKVNDCASCTDICCIGPRSTVSLRFRDIATLIDIGRTELITHEKPNFATDDRRGHPALERTLHSTNWQRFPVLQKNSFGACAALTDEGKCGIYPHWPLSCERFPYALDVDASLVFYSSRCRSFWIRDGEQGRVEQMKAAAAAGYNERIKDLVLLAYAPERLERLGLTRFLAVPPTS
jgi:Fe-S-cluster containining protein